MKILLDSGELEVKRISLADKDNAAKARAIAAIGEDLRAKSDEEKKAKGKSKSAKDAEADEDDSISQEDLEASRQMQTLAIDFLIGYLPADDVDKVATFEAIHIVTALNYGADTLPDHMRPNLKAS